MSSTPNVKVKKKIVKPGEKKKQFKKTSTNNKDNITNIDIEQVDKEPVVKKEVSEENTSTNNTTTVDTTLITEETNIVEDSKVEDSKVEDKKDPISEILNSLLDKYDALEKESRSNKNELKKVIKLYEKKSYKNKRKHNPNRTPSGFAKPSTITDELCKFLNKPIGSKMARTDVTREVNNNLQNPENKKKITPDETLRSLLKVSENDNSLTYFSMQKYLKDHFPKENTTVVS